MTPATVLLSHSDSAVVEQACQALACLVADCPRHQAAAAQAGAVDSLMQLLLQAPPDSSCDPQLWRLGLLHLMLAVLLVTTDVSHASYLYHVQTPVNVPVLGGVV